MEPLRFSGATILIVDDTPSNLSVLFDSLNASGFTVLVAEDGETALERAKHELPELILLDVMMPGIDGFETCRRLKQSELTRDIPVIFLTSLMDTPDKVKGFQVGGLDYITKPLQHEEVLARVRTQLTIQKLRQSLKDQNLRLQQEIDAYQRSQATVHYLNHELNGIRANVLIVGQGRGMRELLDRTSRVAETDCTVLIEGETGTGKDLLARFLHDESPRSEQPFVKIDCASIPKDVAERELFGTEQGAFGSVSVEKIGRFELADGGTIFLDEVAELPLTLQSKLLRVLQDQAFERVGGTVVRRVDVRIVAATNSDLREVVEKGGFRKDLYFRLNVVPLKIPPLRERKDDIRLLVEHFFDKHVVRLGNRVKKIDEATIERLEEYHWPGNVRELENLIERALILSSDPVLEIDEHAFQNKAWTGDTKSVESYEEIEKTYILDALKRSNWMIEGPLGAARSLGIDSDSLRSRMAKIGIVQPGPVSEQAHDIGKLTERAFETAVKEALQCYIQTDRLQRSPLLHCELVNSKIGTASISAPRIDALRSILRETAKAFARHPKTEIFSRVLYRTYFEPARSQELAAEALGLGYSTYRRHLGKARSLLTAELWQSEQQNRV